MNNKGNSSEFDDFLKEISVYFWWVPEDKKKNLKLESIVEATLNYGSTEQVKKLFELYGLKEVAEIFYKQINNQRDNYFPQVKNFFDLYFKRHAQRDSDK